jgi:hypothetical protein
VIFLKLGASGIAVWWWSWRLNFDLVGVEHHQAHIQLLESTMVLSIFSPFVHLQDHERVWLSMMR